jgi:mannosyltransferase
MAIPAARRCAERRNSRRSYAGRVPAAVRSPADLGPRWLPALPAALLAALGGVLVGQRQALWYDELYTAVVAPVPLADLVRAVASGEGTAPYLDGIPPSYNAPYYVLTHLWLLLTPFGADDVGLRLPSLLAAVAAAAGLTRAVQHLAGPAVGLAAGLLVAANPLVVEYAAEARGYGLALLATATTALGLARWLRGRGLLVYGVGATAMGLAHWFAVPALAGLAVAAVVLRRRAALPLVAVTALAVVPVGGLVVLSVVNGAGGDNVGFIRDLGVRLPVFAVRAWTAESVVLTGATLLAVAVGLARGGRSAAVGAAWVGVPLVLLTAAQLARPVFVPRYLLPSLLGIALLAALGTATWRRPVAVAVTGGLLAASLWAGLPLLDRGPREDGRAAVAHLADRVGPGEPVVAADARAALALAYYGGRLEEVVLPPDDAPLGPDVVWVLRQTTPTGLRKSDDDALLAARGLRVVDEHVVPGSNTALVVQRWAR